MKALEKRDIREVMQKKGFLLLSEAAKRCGVSPPSIHNWAKDGSVQVEVISHRAYVNWVTLVKHIGVDKAILLEIIKKEDAHKYK